MKKILGYIFRRIIDRRVYDAHNPHASLEQIKTGKFVSIVGRHILSFL